jgi:hypothetical protein
MHIPSNRNAREEGPRRVTQSRSNANTRTNRRIPGTGRAHPAAASQQHAGAQAREVAERSSITDRDFVTLPVLNEWKSHIAKFPWLGKLAFLLTSGDDKNKGIISAGSI